MRRLRKAMQKLVDSTAGTAVVETAIVAPVLAVVIMGIVDVADYGAAKLKVQQAINRGLEMAMIGGPSTATTAIQTEVADHADVTSDKVTVTQLQTCNDADTTWGNSCSSGQELKRFIKIDLVQTYEPQFVGPLASFISNTDGPVSISASGTLRVQ